MRACNYDMKLYRLWFKRAAAVFRASIFLVHRFCPLSQKSDVMLRIAVALIYCQKHMLGLHKRVTYGVPGQPVFLFLPEVPLPEIILFLL